MAQRDRNIAAAAHDIKSAIASLPFIVDLLKYLLEAEVDLVSLEHVIHRLDRPITIGKICAALNLPLTSKVETLGRNVECTNELIVAILDYFKLDKYVPHIQTHASSYIVDNIATTKEDAIVSHGMNLVVESDSTRFTTDYQLIHRIVQNLIDNAIKYSPDGGDIFLSARVEDGQLQIVVRDTGIGISPENLPQIFEPFHQLDSTRNGIGIGLATCKKIVDKLGGTITVDSTPNVGTQFTISIPPSSI